MNVIKFIKKELAGQKWYDWAFMVVGLVLQLIAITVGFITGEPESPILIVSGLTGVVSVVLCSWGKISFYAFGFVQLFTYVFGFSVPNHLHGETIENGMYFVTMLAGMVIWFKNYRNNDKKKSIEIKAKKLGWKGNAITAVIFIVGTILYWKFLQNVKMPWDETLDSQPFVDSITSVPAYIAQFFMVFGFREQWIYWCILDVGSVVLAARAGSPIMVCQFIFWTINTIYGFWKWHKSAVYENYRIIDWKK